MHQGIILTIAAIRENYWIPKLEQSKDIQKIPANDSLHNNKAFFLRFQVSGTDFAVPIMTIPQQEQRQEKGIYTSIHMTFNKSNKFRITARSNQTIAYEP